MVLLEVEQYADLALFIMNLEPGHSHMLYIRLAINRLLVLRKRILEMIDQYSETHSYQFILIYFSSIANLATYCLNIRRKVKDSIHRILN